MQKIILVCLIATFTTSCSNLSEPINAIIPKNSINRVHFEYKLKGDHVIHFAELPVIVEAKEIILKFSLDDGIQRQNFSEKFLQMNMYPDKEVQISYSVGIENIAVIVM